MIFCWINPYFITTVFWRACQVKIHSGALEYIYKYYLSFHQKTTKKWTPLKKHLLTDTWYIVCLTFCLSIDIRMNSTADEKKNEDTHESGGSAENEINNLKLYVLGSIIILTLLGNFLILFLVSSNILLL